MDSDGTNNNDEPRGPGVRRRYKSCRICRRQKLRCDGGNPCRRCRVSGGTCIYDQSAGRRRNPNPSGTAKEANTSQAQVQQFETLSAQVQRLQQVVTQSAAGSASVHQPTSSEGQTALQPYAPGGGPPTNSTTRGVSAPPGYDTSPDDLEQPVTAVHVMVHPNRKGTAGRWTPHNQSRWNREEYHVGSVIERALVDESEARRLFGAFMQDCNIATPIFDPVLDTFESVRELYPLTLTVVLFLAARQDPTNDVESMRTLEMESRRLAADTLFENPCSLDSVKAMLLLAVHSEKTWFAIGHTLQMARDLGLDLSAHRAVNSPETCSRYDFHCARLWIFVVYFERAVALGTARTPRCKNVLLSELEILVKHRYSHPSDIFFYGSLELFDMSAALRHTADLPNMEKLEHDMTVWYTRWNAHYDEQCIHSSSLQRIHLTIQLLFAKAWQLGTCLVRQLRSQPQNQSQNDITLLLDHITQTTHTISQTIAGSAAYKRFFSWSPTSEVMLLTFTAILNRKALTITPSTHSSNEKHTQFRDFVNLVADLLRKHPCQIFSKVVDDLILHHNEQASSHGSRSNSMHDGAGEGAVEAIAQEANANVGWFENDWAVTSAQFEELFGDWTNGADLTITGMMGTQI